MARHHYTNLSGRRSSTQSQAPSTRPSSSPQYSNQSRQHQDTIRDRFPPEVPEDYTDTQMENDLVSVLDDAINRRRSEPSDVEDAERPSKRK